MKRLILALTAVLAVGLLAGCGSSGTSSGSSVSISGKVADGYLEDATVFLDKNSNYQMDSGEPFATTDLNGAYILNVNAADIGRYPIVAVATKGVTIDKDTGTVVANSYLLSMPAMAVSGTASSNFISPMSSELRELMETNKYSTIQEAMEALRTQLGMPGINLMSDYMATNNALMHTAAQNMASLMGSQMPQVFTNNSSSGVDVNRYRGMMGTIFSNMSSIRGSGSNVQTVMTDLMGTMTTTLTNMPMLGNGQIFQNMSTAFRGGMMGRTGSSPMGFGMM
ncbi:MAG: hypothetical protein PHY09_09115 [Desulfuromonadaceae bacterium]|nr:hypothetical protein [Desulfuromonadaceae bacterium]MDD5107481.1 hypothetical protein [Desulfuromonadaceae bacterium]